MSLSSATGSFALPNPSANIVITGLGFQPKIIFFWSMAQTSGSDALGAAVNSYLNRNFGAADGTNQWCQSFWEKDGSSGGQNTQAACSITYCIVHGKGNANDPYATYLLNSMDSDGFTLHPQTAGTAPAVDQVRIFYLALGGSAITGTALGSIALSGTGAQNVTGLGITPGCVVTALSGTVPGTLYTGGPYATASLSVGFSDGTRQGTIAHMASGTGPNNQQRHYAQHNECYSGVTIQILINPTLDNRGYIDTFVSGGFTLHKIASVVGASLCYAAIAGLSAYVGNFQTKTDTSTHMVQTGCGFSPAAALILSACDVEATQGTLQGSGGTDNSGMSIGAFSSSSSRLAYGEASINPGSPSHDDSAIAYDKVYQNVLSGSSPSVQGAMDMVSVDSDGFTTVMSTADPQANMVFYLAFGVPAPPTYSISGSAGVAAASVGYTGTASGSVTADGSGNYSITGLAAGSYTITPTKSGYTFSPASASETVSSSNITGVNFTASSAAVKKPNVPAFWTG